MSALSKFHRRFIPEFVHQYHPRFAQFLESYFEFISETRLYSAGEYVGPYEIIANLLYNNDVDLCYEEYLRYTKNKIAVDYPVDRRVFENTYRPNKPVEERKHLLKLLFDFYKRKGTQVSVAFLFRSVFDETADVYIPKTDILSASAGKWYMPTYIRFSGTNTGTDFTAYEGAGILSNRSKARSWLTVASSVPYQLIELAAQVDYTGWRLYGDTSGASAKIHLIKDVSGTTYNSITEYEGEFQVGENVTVVSPRGDTVATAINSITTTTENWVAISDGSGFELGDSIKIRLSDGTEIDTTITETEKAIEKWLDDSGFISSRKKIQDSYYYQNFSYEIRSQLGASSYTIPVQDNIHPAGMKQFSKVESVAPDVSNLDVGVFSDITELPATYIVCGVETVAATIATDSIYTTVILSNDAIAYPLVQELDMQAETNYNNFLSYWQESFISSNDLLPDFFLNPKRDWFSYGSTNLNVVNQISLTANGVPSDGLTDTTSQINTLIQNAPTGSTILFDGAGTYRIDGTVKLKDGINLKSESTASIVMGASGRIRVFGDTDELPTSNYPILTTDANAGDTVLNLNDTTPYSVGDIIRIRGEKDENGIAIPDADGNFYETHKVVGKTATTLTIADPLKNSYLIQYVGSAYETATGNNDYTRVTMVVGGFMSDDANRGEYQVALNNITGLSVGDTILISDNMLGGDIIPDSAYAAGRKSTVQIHFEVRKIADISQNVVTLDIPLSHSYKTANNAQIEKILPIDGMVIDGLNITCDAAASSTSIHPIHVWKSINCLVKNCTISGHSNHAIRIEFCLDTIVDNCSIGAPYTGKYNAGEGYGITNYGTSNCTIKNCDVTSCRHSFVVFKGCNGTLIENCTSADCWASDFDTHGGNEIDIWIKGCSVTGGPNIAADTTSKKAIKIGNEKHWYGSHGVLITDCKVNSYTGYGLFVMTRSSDVTAIRLTGENCDYAIGLDDVQQTNFVDSTTYRTYRDEFIYGDTKLIDAYFKSCVQFCNISAGLYDTITGTTYRGVRNLLFYNITDFLGQADIDRLKFRFVEGLEIRNSLVTDVLYSTSGHSFNMEETPGLVMDSNTVVRGRTGIRLTSINTCSITNFHLDSLYSNTVVNFGGGSTAPIYIRGTYSNLSGSPSINGDATDISIADIQFTQV